MTVGCRLYGPDPEGIPDAPLPEHRKRLFARLAEAMQAARHGPDGTDGAGDENPRIPAGHTYLAQFAAHDLVFSTLTRPRLSPAAQGSGPIAPEFANSALDLGSLYGPGPEIRPELYQPAGRAPRTRLAVAPMPVAENSFRARADWSAPHPLGPGHSVLPRVVAQVPEQTAVTADPRNNLHFLISQMTVLFAWVHNLVTDRVEAAGGRDGHETLATARTMVLAAYRDILLHDFLARLLDDATHAAIASACAAGRMDGFLLLSSGAADRPVSRAFSSAAYRVGHAMARGDYVLSPAFPERRPANFARLMTLTHEASAPARLWHIEWDRFFFDDSAPRCPDGRRRNFAHLIRPGINRTLGDRGFFPGGDGIGNGLAYLDMLRAARDGLDESDPFLDARLPGIARLDTATRAALMAESLPSLAAGDRAALAARTPFALYVLLEAQACGGTHLGPAAARIVGEVFGAGLIDAAEETARGRALWRDLIGGDVPRTMTGLLAFVATHSH